MYVSVQYKDPAPKKGDSDIIKCHRFHASPDRLNFFQAKESASLFLSISMDQIAVWEIVESPVVVTPKPDNIVVVPINTYARDELRKGGYAVSQEGKNVTLPIYYKK